jgi:hypothetical protein
MYIHTYAYKYMILYTYTYVHQVRRTALAALRSVQSIVCGASRDAQHATSVVTPPAACPHVFAVLARLHLARLSSSWASTSKTCASPRATRAQGPRHGAAARAAV